MVNAIAAHHTYKTEALVIDSGTALTFCYIDRDGVYQGGAIFPGMKICSDSLHEKTAKIPLIWVEETNRLYGKSTKEAVEIGLYEGFTAIINHMISKYRAEFPNITVIGTGNGLDIFKDKLNIDVYDNQLIFKGLLLLKNSIWSD